MQPGLRSWKEPSEAKRTPTPAGAHGGKKKDRKKNSLRRPTRENPFKYRPNISPRGGNPGRPVPRPVYIHLIEKLLKSAALEQGKTSSDLDFHNKTKKKKKSQEKKHLRSPPNLYSKNP